MFGEIVVNARLLQLMEQYWCLFAYNGDLNNGHSNSEAIQIANSKVIEW